MKKILSLLLVMLMLLSVVPLSVVTSGAETATSGTVGNLTWEVEGKVLTISGEGAIPDMPNNTPPWPDYIEKVVIEEGVTRIGRAAFCDFGVLREVYIPKTVTSIGEIAFYYCEDLYAVYIEDLAAWCNIDFADMNSNPLFYGTMLVYNGNSVHHLIIPDGVKTIKKYAFVTIKYISALTVPNSVEIIEDYAFTWSNFITVDLGNAVHTIGESAFFSCDTLVELSLPVTLKNIGNNAFDHINEKAKVWYGGSLEQRNNIPYLKERDKDIYTADTYNLTTKATWHYNTCRIHTPGNENICSACGSDVEKENLIQIGKEWHYYKDGVRTDKTTLVSYKDKLFYVENGVWTKTTTIVKYKGEDYFVSGGKVDFEFLGNKKISGKTYKIKNGKAILQSDEKNDTSKAEDSAEKIETEGVDVNTSKNTESSDVVQTNENQTADISKDSTPKEAKEKENSKSIVLIILIFIFGAFLCGAAVLVFVKKRKFK